MTKNKRNKAALWIASICAFGLVMGLVACAPQKSSSQTAGQKADESQQAGTPEADEYGVVLAESWKDVYPDQYNSYMANEANSPDSGKHDYLELYPALNTMYKGYAFALGYDEASSHLYTLQSVSESPRTTQKEQSANCITCKTPQFTALVTNEGDTVYAQKFNDLIGQFTEPISCYNCHENDPSTLTVTGTHWTNAIGSAIEEVPEGAAVCGQCHNEYYFPTDTKVTSYAYSNLEEMTPESILAFYDEKGFKDWEHADTMAPMIKVQHPEFETMYGGTKEESGPMAQHGYACSDCHMAATEGENGEYTSHNWSSPLANASLIENNCSQCHEDIVGEVRAVQDEEETRVTAISEDIEAMTNAIAAKYADEIAALKAKKDAGEEYAASAELAQLQQLQREAQFYWDFVMVENSEGAHNPTLTWKTLDKAQAAVDEAMALLA